ncbi:MAG: hypothetical protein EPN88_11345, partial [Bacteroidetes bacterium]
LKVIQAKSISDRLFGLNKYKKPVAILLKTRFGIHTFGLSYSIDVLIVSKEKKVVRMKRSLKPNRFFFWNPRYNVIVELPEGTINRVQIEINDFINLKLKN